MFLAFELKDGSVVYAFDVDTDRHPKEYVRILPPDPVFIAGTWSAWVAVPILDSIHTQHQRASASIREAREKREMAAYQAARKEM